MIARPGTRFSPLLIANKREWSACQSPLEGSTGDGQKVESVPFEAYADIFRLGMRWYSEER